MSKSKATTSDKSYLGIDYGATNIGVALGKNGFVTPLKIINGKSQNTAISQLIRVALENKAEAFIMGLPLTPDGKETAQSLKNRKFAKLLKILSKKPVIFINEEDSTQEALQSMDIQKSTRKRKVFSDDIAAAIILRRFFQEPKKEA
ncbi:hypothetical protein A2380_02395 [candidate division WWE3 bacterium RIFOXYB1_FULL_43_24]|uniref:Putative pre-16S rRNA nuclease n=2 Tax=Katanobacteria TaxID=422282 RepID=A0A0G1BHG2_UNCKA|nr:MAG: hypothetical protein UU92_C0008G0004 [candidate division WWE3 bacterium GW2011_GWA1_42_12]KKS33741.1 MAG: hypothetical protein UU97_C0022G0003 [candidate division WWE3 bacterium GW2011_GWD1_42_14]KKS36903.1 MAG: hypothetical protein UV00_C0019G0004 [candidate division WWE3 bacterium GW2011_GWF1_42_14]KKS39776.1 MAG: hypothetical protein UV03_C0021G0003 [candidate division WWE3 bacterium GW2011_GWE1_42_16]KKS65920.1 MAG: hypothetical protein UV35_C0029G0009 [candidate division WWE3 bacte